MSAQRTIAKLRSEVEFLHLACAQLEEQRDAQRIRAILTEEHAAALIERKKWEDEGL